MYPESGSVNAPAHDFLMDLINVITIICFILVNAALVYFIIRYRRRGPNDVTSSISNSHTIEIIWTVIPSIVFFALYVVGLKGFIDLRAASSGSDRMEINVWAKQWAWDYEYPASLRENKSVLRPLRSSGVLYVEEGRPTKMIMKSKDVLHSFFVPAFRLKEDVVPHMYTFIAFTPIFSQEQKDKPEAVYDIFCAEYCGNDHSYMGGQVHVLRPEDFKRKMKELEDKEGNIGASVGQEIFAGNCKSCHTLDGSRLVGPTFKGLYGNERELEGGTTAIADENYLTESMLNPSVKVVKGYPPAMPAQNLDDAQIQSVIEFLKTVK